MSCYVKIVDNVVVQKQPDYADGFLEAPDDVICGQVYTDTGYMTPKPEFEAEDALAKYRFVVECGGVEYLGKHIQTDRETRANWIGILLAAQKDTEYKVTWKTLDNTFVEYNAQEAVGAALTVSSHVQKCFWCEAEALKDIAKCSDDTQVKQAFDTLFNLPRDMVNDNTEVAD